MDPNHKLMVNQGETFSDLERYKRQAGRKNRLSYHYKI